MIFRNCVWFSPPQPPIIIDNIDMVRIRFRLIDGEIWYSTDMGEELWTEVHDIVQETGIKIIP